MVKFGVIGTNWITDRFIKAASHLDDFSLAAVYSRTEEKAQEFADKYHVKYTYTDLEQLAQNKEIEAVYIASPNALHAEQAILLMEHGKHVLVEKPLASNSREVQQMIDAARSNNVLLMEALKTTLLPNFQVIQNNLDKIGTVRRYFSSYCQYSSRYDAYKEGTVLNAFKPEFSNGSLMDIGVYCVYPMVTLFGKPKRLQANSLMLDSGVDGQGSITFEYEEMSGTILYSKIANSYLPSEIQGEKGSIIIDNINDTSRVEIKYKDGSVEDISQPQSDDTMYYEAAEFIQLIQDGKTESSINTYERSFITVELLEEARKQTGIIFPADNN